MMSFDAVLARAKHVLVRDGRHSSFALCDVKGEIAVLPLDFDDDSGKVAVLLALRSAVRKFGVERYIIIDEVWYSDSADMRPSMNHDRKEALAVFEYRKDGVNRSVMVPFTRDGDKIVLGEDSETKDFHSLFNVYLELEGLTERMNLDTIRKNIKEERK